jgi:plastocyanin
MKRLPTMLACCALGAAGCGGGGGTTDTNAQATQPTSATVAPTTVAKPGGAGQVVVDMKDIKYVPQHVDVKVGQTVKWTNSDAVAHTVTADKGASFDSGTINVGGTYQWKAAKPGEIHYFCTIHGQVQSGTITVK